MAGSGEAVNSRFLIVGLRPTTDRVRETLFNWLAPVIVDAQCLDCFAGSGALGLEALSRYAAGATLIEMDRAVSQQLIKNLATLKAGNARVVNSNAMSFWRKKAHRIISCLSIHRSAVAC